MDRRQKNTEGQGLALPKNKTVRDKYMENPASVQAMLADIYLGNCGNFEETQLISTIMTNYRHIMKQYLLYTVHLDSKLVLQYMN